MPFFHFDKLKKIILILWEENCNMLAEHWGDRKSLEILKVEVKVIFCVFLVIFLLKLCLQLIASKASEENLEKLAFWA